MYSTGQTERLVGNIVQPFINLTFYNFGNLLQNREFGDLIAWFPLLGIVRLSTPRPYFPLHILCLWGKCDVQNLRTVNLSNVIPAAQDAFLFTKA